MAVRDIVLVPNSILTSPSTAVSDPLAPEIQLLLRDLKETVVAVRGIGLAAPQIGVPLRVIVINDRVRHYAAFVNPEILWSSHSTSVLEEGCLSIPGVVVPVSRPRKVRLRALDASGGRVELAAADLLAKIFQHEIDHLNGILITSYAERSSNF